MTEEESIKEGYVQGTGVIPFIVTEWETLSSPSIGLLEILQRIRTPKIYFYRVDYKGQAQKGHQEHYHIYKDEKQRNQVFAINKDGSFHDGTSYRFSNEWIEALNGLGISTENIDKRYRA